MSDSEKLAKRLRIEALTRVPGDYARITREDALEMAATIERLQRELSEARVERDELKRRLDGAHMKIREYIEDRDARTARGKA